MTKFWTKKDLAVLKNMKLSHAEVAKLLGRSPEAVRIRRQTMGLAGKPLPAHEPTLKAELTEADNKFWQGRYSELHHKYQRLLKDNVVSDRLVRLAADLAPLKYSPPPLVTQADKQPHSRQGARPQSAVLLLSDTHVGQVVTPDQTLGFGLYNFDVFMARLKALEQTVIKIKTEHVNTPVPELVLCLGGDMLDGALDHGAEAGQQNTLFNQFFSAGHVFAQFIRNLAAHFLTIRS